MVSLNQNIYLENNISKILKQKKGSYFTREKRIKFSERWRQLLDIDSNGISQTKKDVYQEFVNAGLSDIAKETDYYKVFDKSDMINNGNGNQAVGFGIGMTATYVKKSNKTSNIEFPEQLTMTEAQIQEEINFYMTYVDDISLQMNIGLKTLNQYKNLYTYSPLLDVNICVKADNNRIDEKVYERLKPIINSHEKFIRDNLEAKEEVKKNIVLLKLVSMLVPIFTALKKRMKIPDLNNLLPPLTGDEVHTERELPVIKR
jgi:hypothetical protein